MDYTNVEIQKLRDEYCQLAERSIPTVTFSDYVVQAHAAQCTRAVNIEKGMNGLFRAHILDLPTATPTKHVRVSRPQTPKQLREHARSVLKKCPPSLRLMTFEIRKVIEESKLNREMSVRERSYLVGELGKLKREGVVGSAVASQEEIGRAYGNKPCLVPPNLWWWVG